MLYHFRQALLAMRANVTATVATLTTMTLTLTLLGLVSLTTLNIERTLRSIESEVQVQAFLAPAASAAQATAQSDRILTALQAIPEVASAKFVPKEEAYAELAVDYPYLSEATRIVDNPLPDAVRVKLTSARDVERVAAAIESIPGVDDVEFGQAYVRNAVNAIEAVRVGGYALVVLLLANSLFNILNTIRVAMYARRDEINVMRLIGATRGFIRAPYVLDGVGLGIIAGLATAAAVYPLYMAGSARLQELAPFLPITRDPADVIRLLIVLVALGAVVGLVGSLTAANRYLREVE